MFEYKTTGKTINEAIEKGLHALKLDKNQVTIKVQKAPSGFKPAVVLLCVSDEILAQNEHVASVANLENLEQKIAETENLLKVSMAEKNNILESLNAQILQSDGESFDMPKIVELTKQFLENAIKLCGIKNFEIATLEEENFVKFDINGDCKKLIGFKGKTIASIQYLANVFAGKYSRKTKKIVVDVNNYKATREKQIENFALEKAKEVLATKTEFAFEPMNAFERRIVHNVVGRFSELKSESVGVEPKRYVLVFRLSNEPAD